MPKETFETYISQKIYNDKNLFIYFSSRGQSCYAYIVGTHSVTTCCYRYERSETNRFEVPRMLFDDQEKLEAYIAKAKDR